MIVYGDNCVRVVRNYTSNARSAGIFTVHRPNIPIGSICLQYLVYFNGGKAATRERRPWVGFDRWRPLPNSEMLN
jgi:hypothetical protein